jgi:alpha-tubulin suppressor-like RCC1 family protein
MNLRHIAFVFLAWLIPCVILPAAAPGEVVIWGNKQQSTNHFTERLEIGRKPVTDAVGIAAGRTQALILRADGTVLSWGRGFHGETNIPAGLKNVVEVATGAFFSLALDKDGNVSGWGLHPTDSGGLGDVIAISASCRSLALKRDGRVFSWSGTDGWVSRLTNIVAIAAGGGDFERNLALRKDGTVVAWGDEDVPQGLNNVTAIAVGEYHSLALKSDGTVYGWGDNHCEQATGVKNSKGQRNASGLVVHSGQVLSNVVAIAAGNQYGMFGIVSHHSLALKKDGTVVGWGRICGQPVTVPAGLSNVVAIAAGQTFCLAITTNAAVAERFRH